MRTMDVTQAADDAIGQAMAADPSIVVMGEDVPLLRRSLLVRFGPERILGTPISESAFVGAGVAAAMAGLRPVVEVYMVDFLGVCMDALLNHAAKLDTFSGGRWNAPVVVRAPCSAGYGDAGQHGQSLWGMLAHVPGLTVAVPSTPADAGALMTTSLSHDGPVVFMEPKLLSESWLEFLGSGGRKTVDYDSPEAGIRGRVPRRWERLPFGQAAVRREGGDVTVAGVGVAVHRALEAASRLERDGIDVGVIDLRTVAPLDVDTVTEAVGRTRRLLVVDEDYEAFGLSGELAAALLERGLEFRFGRVCTRTTIPYARHLEDQVLPSTDRIVEGIRKLVEPNRT